MWKNLLRQRRAVRGRPMVKPRLRVKRVRQRQKERPEAPKEGQKAPMKKVGCPMSMLIQWGKNQTQVDKNKKVTTRTETNRKKKKVTEWLEKRGTESMKYRMKTRRRRIKRMRAGLEKTRTIRTKIRKRRNPKKNRVAETVYSAGVVEVEKVRPTRSTETDTEHRKKRLRMRGLVSTATSLTFPTRTRREKRKKMRKVAIRNRQTYENTNFTKLRNNTKTIAVSEKFSYNFVYPHLFVFSYIASP